MGEGGRDLLRGIGTGLGDGGMRRVGAAERKGNAGERWEQRVGCGDEGWSEELGDDVGWGVAVVVRVGLDGERG